MARYIFLHATQFLAVLLFSTNINNYSLCGDLQLDTKTLSGFTSSQCGMSEGLLPCMTQPHHHLGLYLTCPQCIFLTQGLPLPESPKPYMHFFPLRYYARSSTSTCRVVLTTIKWSLLWASDPKGS